MKRLLQNDESFPHCLTILHDFVLIICSENVLLLHEFILAFITRQAYNSFLYGKKGNVDLSASPYLAIYVLQHATHLLFRNQTV